MDRKARKMYLDQLLGNLKTPEQSLEAWMHQMVQLWDMIDPEVSTDSTIFLTVLLSLLGKIR